MAKFKITLKKDPEKKTNGFGVITEDHPAEVKSVEINAPSACEACAKAVKGSNGFYFTAWECIEEDEMSEEQKAEAAKNKKFLEEWEAKNSKKKDDETEEAKA